MLATIFMNFNWKEIMLGNEEWSFLWEVLLRTGIMFLIIITCLRILGKRSVKQLSIFELVVIIGLGSAAGDPMFYKDVGIASSLVVFIVVIIFYSIITFIIGKFQKFEKLMEGSPICLIRDGKYSINNFKREKIGAQELMSELRLRGVSQLGQVEIAIEEMTGDVSVFFYADKDVKYGLPIMPDSLKEKIKYIKKEGHYSCEFCGHTEFKSMGAAGKCIVCEKDEWVPANNKKRIS